MNYCVLYVRSKSFCAYYNIHRLMFFLVHMQYGGTIL